MLGFYKTVNPKHPKVEPIRQPTLFQMEKLDKATELAPKPKIERQYSLPGILLGTSAFIAAGWRGSFYPSDALHADSIDANSIRHLYSSNASTPKIISLGIAKEGRRMGFDFELSKSRANGSHETEHSIRCTCRVAKLLTLISSK